MIKEIRYTGVTATPSDYISPDGELDAAINLVPENGELVVEQGGEVKDTLGEGDEVVCVHDVNSGVKHLIIKNDNSLYYRLYGDTEKKLIKTYESSAFKCSVMGNVLCVYGIGEIEHWLFIDGEYKSSSTKDIDVSILFGVDVGSQPRIRGISAVVLRALLGGKIGKWDNVINHKTDANRDTEEIEFSCYLTPKDDNGNYIVYRINPVYDTNEFKEMRDAYVYTVRVKYKDDAEWREGKKEYFVYGVRPQFTTYSFGEFEKAIVAFQIKATDDDLDYLSHVKIDRLVEETMTNPWGGVEGGNLNYGNWERWRDDYLKVNAQYSKGGYAYHCKDDVNNEIYGGANSLLADIKKENKFALPFFVRYGWRMVTGDIVCASAPILVEPNTSAAPVLEVSNIDWAGDGYEYPGTSSSEKYSALYSSSVSAKLWAGELKYCVRDKDKLKQLEEGKLVDSLVIAVSDPIYMFNQGASFEEIDNEAYISQTTNNQSYSLTGVKNTQADGCVYIELPKHKEKYEDRLINSAVYKIIKEIKIGDIITTDVAETQIGAWSSVLESRDAGVLSALDSNTNTMPDNIQNLNTYDAEYVFAYNQREHIVGGSNRGYAGFDLDAMCGYVRHQTKSINYEVVLNGENEHVVRGKKTESGRNRRWIYFPNRTAKELTTYGSNNDWWKTSLKEHPLLSGAYHFGEEFSHGTGVSEDNLNKDKHVVSEEHHNMIEVSAQASPTIIEQTLSVGDGQLLAATSNTVALAQEQFGNSPIYIFSTEGVWVIEVSSDGKYSSRKPVSRDVCINPDSIVQIDNAVIFNTDRGIMLLSGSESICISETIDSPAAFTTDILPKLNALPHGAVGAASDMVPFREFLKQSRMLYDYNNQRIIVYNPEQIYAYVYSLKSKQWGMMESNIKYGINSYPECLAVDDENNIVNMSKVELEEGTKDCLIISRPLKLDDGDLLKTIDTIITRGKFRKGAVKTILYGSRDLFSWHLVASSVDHYLRGFRGTPYKYFRIVLACDLQKDESIFGSTIQYTPRLVDKIR